MTRIKALLSFITRFCGTLENGTSIPEKGDVCNIVPGCVGEITTVNKDSNGRVVSYACKKGHSKLLPEM